MGLCWKFHQKSSLMTRTKIQSCKEFQFSCLQQWTCLTRKSEETSVFSEPMFCCGCLLCPCLGTRSQVALNSSARLRLNQVRSRVPVAEGSCLSNKSDENISEFGGPP